MAGVNVGYIRVSTVEQNSGRQLECIEVDKMFEDKVSGWSLERPGWVECKAYLREGDTLYVHSIDRLARNLEDLQKTVRELTERGITLQFVKENLVFQGKDDPFQVLMFHMVGAFAQFERALIKERQREGIEQAKKQGRYRGGKRKLNAQQRQEVVALVQSGVPKSKVAKQFGVTRPVVYALLSGGDKRRESAKGE
jgi:DNA invertase Pin-like site-specific DNA recombinase